MRRFEKLPLADLIAHLRQCGGVWLRNDDLMLLEELISRMQLAEEREQRRCEQR